MALSGFSHLLLAVLPLIATAAARYYEQEEWLNSPFRKYTPWALADAARVCLAYGTGYNRADASERDLLQILNAYSRFEDPVVRDHDARGACCGWPGNRCPHDYRQRVRRYRPSSLQLRLASYARFVARGPWFAISAHAVMARRGGRQIS